MLTCSIAQLSNLTRSDDNDLELVWNAFNWRQLTNLQFYTSDINFITGEPKNERNRKGINKYNSEQLKIFENLSKLQALFSDGSLEFNSITLRFSGKTKLLPNIRVSKRVIQQALDGDEATRNALLILFQEPSIDLILAFKTHSKISTFLENLKKESFSS